MKKVYFLSIITITLFCSCEGVSDFLLGIHRRDIKYEVTGTASSANITISNEYGGTSQINSVSLPWNKKISIELYEDPPLNTFYAYVLAQNTGTTGNIIVRIYVNGDLFQSASSDAPYGVATAFGNVKYSYY